MRIRKRQAMIAGLDDGPLPVTCKYQKLGKEWDDAEAHGSWGAGRGGTGCKGAMQEEQYEELRHSDANVGSHDDGSVPGSSQNQGVLETLVPKRRKVKSGPYLGKMSKSSAQKRNVSNHANSNQKRPRDSTGDNSMEQVANIVNPVANSKEALISSIFFVFDTLGKDGLTASEVVSIMLEQDLPGLKEGGARHTVQVANVLRSSPYFISIGSKRYLPCSSVEGIPGHKNRGRGSHENNGEGIRQEDGAQDDGLGHHQRQGQAHAKSHPKDAHVEQDNVRRRGSLVSQQRKGRTHCKLYDGTGWQCTQQAQPGFSLCAYHLDLINRPAGKLKNSPSPGRSLNESLHSDVKSEGHDSEGRETPRVGRPHPMWNGDGIAGAPVQKRKMLSLLSIK